MRKSRLRERERRAGDDTFFNVRLPAETGKQLRRQAEKEDRTMAYLVRVFVKAGLDDRARGERNR